MRATRGYVVIDEERCKGCEICVSVCPTGVLVLADRFNHKGYRPAMMWRGGERLPPHSMRHPFESWRSTANGREGECTGCTLCARMCPDVAITVYRTANHPSRRGGVSERPR
ncbi:MAG: 4Fe-4S dicluster domain-containing protein [Chloroflexi bacterium]|nr:4Fe-4S dicluster domain-containing protein [Chloroflexota bacterium]MCL5074329.1 4Fe-4S dicluster domain-containing protein [Chloroflexota bacterium]